MSPRRGTGFGGSIMIRIAVLAASFLGFASTAAAQEYQGTPRPGGERSANIRLLSHLPPVMAGQAYSVADIEIEQELSRPYAYMDRRKVPTGFDIINLKDPTKPFILYSWRIENPELHRGDGSVAPAY